MDARELSHGQLGQEDHVPVVSRLLVAEAPGQQHLGLVLSPTFWPTYTVPWTPVSMAG